MLDINNDNYDISIIIFVLVLFLCGIIFVISEHLKNYKVKKKYNKLRSDILTLYNEIDSSIILHKYKNTLIVQALYADSNRLHQRLRLGSTDIYSEIEYFNIKYANLLNSNTTVNDIIKYKDIFESNIAKMLKFLNLWEFHPEAKKLINYITNSTKVLELDRNLPYLYDSIKTKYTNFENDINTRTEIIKGKDLKDYKILLNKTQEIIKKLNLDIAPPNSYLEISTDLLNKIKKLLNDDINKNWVKIKELWLNVELNLTKFNSKCENIVKIDIDYYNTITFYPNKQNIIEKKFEKAEIDVSKKGVSTTTKDLLKKISSDWKSVNIKELNVFEAIEKEKSLKKMKSILDALIDKATRDHKQYKKEDETITLSSDMYINGEY